MPINPTDTECALTHDLWLMGRPTLAILDKGQKRWVKKLQSKPDNEYQSFCWMIGRQRGKTFAAITWAVEYAMNTPNAIIRYLAKTKESAKEIITPTIEMVLASCPEHLKPTFNKDEHRWEWKNGAILKFAGTDAESFARQRGPRSHIILLDESAFYQKLPEVESALIAQLQSTNGWLLYLSTPPLSPSHPFVARYRSAEFAGRSEHETIEDNPRLGAYGAEQFLRSEAARMGQGYEDFRASTYCRREYFAEIVTEESRAAIPTWTPQVAKECTIEIPRPKYFDAYVAYDPGGRDPHFVAFSYWHFELAALVVEDELEMRDSDTLKLASLIKAKELSLYGEKQFDGTMRGAKDHIDKLPEYMREAIDKVSPTQPYVRFSDTSTQAIMDLYRLHGLGFIPTAKDDKEWAVMELVGLVRRKKLIVHPRCKRLISQLESVLWNDQRTEWVRTDGPDGNHGDGVDCFPAGTMIQTETGERPIETIEEGDLVWTRDGLKPVETATQTYEAAKLWRVTLSDGRTIDATAGHPFMTQEGWKPLRELTAGCMPYEWNSTMRQRQRSFFGTADGLGVVQGRSLETIGSTIGNQSGRSALGFIARCGRTPMVRSLLVFMFTTLMAIRLTIRWQISNASRVKSIQHITCSTLGVESIRAQQSRRLNSQRPRGIEARKEGPGMLNTLKTFGQKLCSMTSSALSALAILSQRTSPLAFAAMPVELGGEENRDWTIASSSAQNAKKPSSKTCTPKKNVAHVHVASVAPTGQEACVYNLSIHGKPEYFANGVLVHNCLIYTLRNVNRHRDPNPKPQDLWGTNKPELRDKRENLKRSLGLF